MKPLLVPLATLTFALLTRLAGAATNVACVGDSITYGYGLMANETYPVALQGLLGSTYVVKNFGQNGATMLKNGDNPYWKLALFTQSDMFAPNIVVIMLGTNDSKPGNWVHESEFEGDYTAMVQHYRDLGARVYIAIPPPPVNNPAFWQVEKVIPHIRNVAAATGAPAIDVHAALLGHPEYFADDVHPSAAGAAVLAKTVYTGITQLDAGVIARMDATSGAGGSGGAADAGGKGGAGGGGGASAGASGGSAGRGGASAAGAGGGGGSSSAAGSSSSAGSSAAVSGSGGDAGNGVTGAEESTDSGCACRAGRSAERQPWAFLGLAVGGWWIRRRGRASFTGAISACRPFNNRRDLTQ